MSLQEAAANPHKAWSDPSRRGQVALPKGKPGAKAWLWFFWIKSLRQVLIRLDPTRPRGAPSNGRPYRDLRNYYVNPRGVCDVDRLPPA
jgi:hypothetical protein